MVELLDSYDRFVAALPDLAINSGLDPADLRFPVFSAIDTTVAHLDG